MGTIYPRGNKLWIAWFDENGKRIPKSTGLPIGEEGKARKLLKDIERIVEGRRRVSGGSDAPKESGPLRIRRASAHWIAERKARRLDSASKDERRLIHAFQVKVLFDSNELEFGELPLSEVRPRHVRDVIRALRAKIGPNKSDMAPRSVRHVYGVLRTMFADFVADELIAATPCALKKGELPKKVDKSPTWRSSAVYARDEVEALISEPTIPEHERMLYACLFLTGMRVGELAARTWRDWDVKVDPLSRMLVPTSYSRQFKKLKGVKTERPREVPVHSTLAKLLSAWKLGGWERKFGRAPKPDDLIVPWSDGQYLRDNAVLHVLHRRLDSMGFRRRRTHDTRRTFISLARADGAAKDILKAITHGGQGDQLDEYTTHPWPTLCAEVSKLKIGVREGKLVTLPLAANAASNSGELLQSLLQSKSKNEIPLSISIVTSGHRDARRGTRTPFASHRLVESGKVSLSNSASSPEAGEVQSGPISSPCSNVAAPRRALSGADLELIRKALELGLHATDSDTIKAALRVVAAISPED